MPVLQGSCDSPKIGLNDTQRAGCTLDLETHSKAMLTIDIDILVCFHLVTVMGLRGGKFIGRCQEH